MTSTVRISRRQYRAPLRVEKPWPAVIDQLHARLGRCAPYPDEPRKVHLANTAILAAEMRDVRAERLRAEEATEALRPLNLAIIRKYIDAMLRVVADCDPTAPGPTAGVLAAIAAVAAEIEINDTLSASILRDAIARAERRGYLTGRAEKFAAPNAALSAARKRLRRRRRVLVRESVRVAT